MRREEKGAQAILSLRALEIVQATITELRASTKSFVASRSTPPIIQDQRVNAEVRMRSRSHGRT